MPNGDPVAARRLADTLKALRRLRRMRPAQIAAAMDMPLRSFEHFESGRGGLNLFRLQAFAKATNSDPFAILASQLIDSPEFALRCADNKLMLLLFTAVLDFDEAALDAIARLEPRELVAAFGALFAALAETALRRERSMTAWLSGHADPDDEEPPS